MGANGWELCLGIVKIALTIPPRVIYQINVIKFVCSEEKVLLQIMIPSHCLDLVHQPPEPAHHEADGRVHWNQVKDRQLAWYCT